MTCYAKYISLNFVIVALAMVLSCGEGENVPRPTGIHTVTPQPITPPTPTPQLEDASELAIMAGEVRGVRFTMGDLAERIRALQSINRYRGGRVDFSRIPFQLLTNLLHAEILRQAAPGLGINVTDAQVEEAIRERFRPEAAPWQEIDERRLEAASDAIYEKFLTFVNLDDGEYRSIVEEQLLQRELFARMLASLPEEAPQVEVQAIALGIDSTAAPEAVRERLQLGEDFASVARELTGSDGYLGWVPEGAFPEFDRYLFGEACVDDDAECMETEQGRRKPPLLERGEISSPIRADETIFLIQIIGESEMLEIEAEMQFQMSSALVDEWKDDQLAQGYHEGWVKINFDSTSYAWVSEQVRRIAKQATPSTSNLSTTIPQQEVSHAYTITREVDSTFSGRRRITLNIYAPTAATDSDRLATVKQAALDYSRSADIDAIAVRQFQPAETGGAVARVVYSPDGCGWIGEKCTGEVWREFD